MLVACFYYSLRMCTNDTNMQPGNEMHAPEQKEFTMIFMRFIWLLVWNQPP